MPDLTPNIGAHVSIEKSSLQQVLDVLKTMGYSLVGPTLGEGAIVYDDIDGIDDLPRGWTDRQDAATYQLQKRGDDSYFGYVVGPQSWKKYLYPPSYRLGTVERKNGSYSSTPNDEEAPRYALIGVRACELKAITIQDNVFLGGDYQAPCYKSRRQSAFVLAVNCTEPGGTCFCTSMDAGPQVGPGFDLALTELDDVFVVEIGSDIARHVMSEIPWQPSGAFELQAARRAIASAETRMGRQLDTSDLPDLLYNNLDHPRWDDVAQRCLSCTNCTLVCPTCFCSDVLEISDLTGQKVDRVRVWDSCFSLEFSHVHGGNIRPATRSRYRQWLTHKFASWIDQFGSSGCVGCGRCITWCPVGIDVTEEVAAIRMEGPQQ
ncbi:MAG: 4Fe-4S dicluster domain-containing protein [Chloroflexota bacterium]|nr:4Fe-4S dicluster domain-containing protein [Chloroflexota bacterium]